MKLGILGPPQSGKSTLFAALTRGHAESGSHRGEHVHLGTVKVPDPRLEHLRNLYHRQKSTPAKVDYVDAPAVEEVYRERGALATLASLRDADAFVLVVRAFENPSVPPFKGSVDPARDAAWIAGELLLEDLAVVERRLERLEKAVHVGKKPDDPHEMEALTLVREALESEKPARAAELSKPQAHALRGFQLLSMRPWILVLNADDKALEKGEEAVVGPVRARFPGSPPTIVALSAKTEAELVTLSDQEALEFMDALGIKEPSLTRMIRLSYSALGLVSFFTVGPEDVRAWTVVDGTLAPEAAGAIHSDMERGFIRAEVIGFEDLAAAGTMAKAREKGLLRTEGREYRIRDGDVVNVRFSV